MDDTARYYRQFAAEFFESTVGVDMSPIRERFAALLDAGARVLDAGCGSGRDAKAFAQQGFRVSAFDASPELAARASDHCGFAVEVRTFHDVDEVNAYDGIWCCASLLHVAPEEMPGVVSRLWAALAPGGVLYASFKRGTGTRLHGGRHFTDADESQVAEWLATLPELARSDIWVTDDQRPDRVEKWTNVLATKASGSQRRLVTGDRDHFLPHLSEAMSQAMEVDLAVAFIKTTGLRLLLPDLQAALESKADPLAVDYAQPLEALALLRRQAVQQGPARVEARRRRLVQGVHGPKLRSVGGLNLHSQGWLGEPKELRAGEHGQDILAMLGPLVSRSLQATG